MYRRIEKLTIEDSGFADKELFGLRKVWQDQRGLLESTGAFSDFMKKLQREWAIETGIIERLYSWDRGVTEVLIEHGIDAAIISHRTGIQRDKADSIASMITDHFNIVDGLFQFVTGEQPLTEHYIRAMHQQFTAHQDTVEALTRDDARVNIPLLKGQYKKLPNNPRRMNGTVHEYCPPEFVTDEMGNLINWYRELEDSTEPEVLSAWLHHRFTQIHPFQDGNGRIARALASLVFIKFGLFPLVIRDSDRREYIRSLERADAGDLSPLVRQFARRQRDALLRAISLHHQAESETTADEILASALRILRESPSRQETDILNMLHMVCIRLIESVKRRLESVASVLKQGFAEAAEVSETTYDARITLADRESNQSHYHYRKIIEIAKQFGYYANLERYRAWISLVIETKRKFEYVISFHAVGHGLTGVAAASAFTAQSLRTSEEESDSATVQVACPEFFQFNYLESLADVERRFAGWVESSLQIGLVEWKRSLLSS
jgi:prophage maintenance system killer protein